MAQDVDTLVAALPEPSRTAMNTLRRLVTASHPDISEHVKWNGPSFCIDGDDRITVGLVQKGGVRAVLHRGVKARDATGFSFSDDTGLIQWAAPDRGVVTFADEGAVSANAEAFAAICRRWFEATR